MHNHVLLCGTCHISGLPTEQSGDYVNSVAHSVYGRIQSEQRRVADIERGNESVGL